MNRLPRSKWEFEQRPFLEKSRIKNDLLIGHFDDFCQKLTTACLHNFGPVLHSSDLETLQKRARYDADSSVISDLLLKLPRSCQPWWEVLEKVLLDQQLHMLYQHLNPWEDQGDRLVAAGGHPPSLPPSSSPPHSPLTQPPPPRGSGPRRPYPSSTPLGDTAGLADLLIPLCDTAKWRTLANLLGLVHKDQKKIMDQRGDIHIHLFDMLVDRFGDEATVGMLTQALQQLGGDGDGIIDHMEQQGLIQPVPREGSEAGEGLEQGFENPYENERVGGTSTIASQPPMSTQFLLRVGSSLGNISGGQNLGIYSTRGAQPAGSAVSSVLPTGIDPVNLSATGGNKITMEYLTKSVFAEKEREHTIASYGLSPNESRSSNSLTDTDNENQSPGCVSSVKPLNTASTGPSERMDTAYNSYNSQEVLQPPAVSQMNILSESPLGAPMGHAGLQMDSSDELPVSPQNQYQVGEPPGASNRSMPEPCQSAPSATPLTGSASQQNEGQDAGRDSSSARDTGGSQHTPRVINNFHIIVKGGNIKALSIGEKNKTEFPSTETVRVAASHEVVPPQEPALSESDEETIAEFDAQEHEFPEPVPEQAPDFPRNAQHGFLSHAPEYSAFFQHQSSNNLPAESLEATASASGESSILDQPLPGDPRHQTSPKQVWAPQQEVQEEEAEDHDSLVEESGPPTDRKLPPPQECQEDLTGVGIQTASNQAAIPTYQSHEGDVDIQRWTSEGLCIVERQEYQSVSEEDNPLNAELEERASGKEHEETGGNAANDADQQQPQSACAELEYARQQHPLSSLTENNAGHQQQQLCLPPQPQSPASSHPRLFSRFFRGMQNIAGDLWNLE